MAAQGKAFDLALMRMSYDLLLEEDAKANPDAAKAKSEDDELDGVPARFIGPLLADLVAHEVGHTLGLRHNFKASSLYSLADINSKKLKGQKPFAGSVMDYLPININMQDGETQGDYAMIDVGPYDMWAIEYGYTFDKDLKPILALHAAGASVRDRPGHARSGPAGPALRLHRQPAGLCEEPAQAREAPSRTARDQVRRRRRQLEQGPAWLRADAGAANAFAEHDGQLGRRGVCAARPQGRHRQSRAA